MHDPATGDIHPAAVFVAVPGAGSYYVCRDADGADHHLARSPRNARPRKCAGSCGDCTGASPSTRSPTNLKFRPTRLWPRTQSARTPAIAFKSWHPSKIGAAIQAGHPVRIPSNREEVRNQLSGSGPYSLRRVRGSVPSAARSQHSHVRRPAGATASLVLRKPLNLVDSQKFHGPFPGLQFQPELLPESCVDGGAGRMDLRTPSGHS